MAAKSARVCFEATNGKVKGWVWEGITESDTCVPLRVEEFDDMTLSVHGTMGGASVACRGSNLDALVTDGLLTDYFVMTDANAGTAVALTTDNTASVLLETATYIQPVPTGGSSQTINIVLGGK